MRKALLGFVAIAGLSACLLTACKMPGYSAGGPQASLDQHTFPSTPDAPQTVTLVDWTTGEVIWTVDVPVGKQVTVRFYEGSQQRNDPRRPDLMRWEIQDRGTEYGELDNVLPVPASIHRRLDVTLRKDRPAVARTGSEIGGLPPAEPVAPR